MGAFGRGGWPPQDTDYCTGEVQGSSTLQSDPLSIAGPSRHTREPAQGFATAASFCSAALLVRKGHQALESCPPISTRVRVPLPPTSAGIDGPPAFRHSPCLQGDWNDSGQSPFGLLWPVLCGVLLDCTVGHNCWGSAAFHTEGGFFALRPQWAGPPPPHRQGPEEGL